MQPEPPKPPVTNNPEGGTEFLRLSNAPPPVAPVPVPATSPGRHFLALLLSVGVVLFLVDAVVSLLDDSLHLGGLTFLQFFRGTIGLVSAVLMVVIYCLMGLTPMIPKRLFLLPTLFLPLSLLLIIPFLIFFFSHMIFIEWCVSVAQVIVGIWLLYQLQAGFKFHWPLVTDGFLPGQGFTWGNLIRFVLTNILVLAPVVAIYLFICAMVTVDHFSAGFMTLHPLGFSVQARTYERSDGKKIQLFPMAHVAEADFYRKISDSFPSNSVILIEGVTDEQNLLTNKISYKRMAKSLGLSEQHEQFKPVLGEVVPADVDVSVFSKDTLKLLNLVMFFHAKGVHASDMKMLMDYDASPDMDIKLFDDLLRKRNEHLLGEIRSHLAVTDNIEVPWGVAHMPGVSVEIEKLGFHLTNSVDYKVIRW